MGTGKVLGLMKPVGGGDPIPLTKNEVVVGRRPSCDIRLDFENVSGRHCMLSFTNGTWHVRDLGSTNGTKINGTKLSREQGVMPDDELAIASHLFHIDYEPAAPLMESQHVLEEETVASQHRTSLMELAGMEREDRLRPRSAPKPPEPESPPRRSATASSEPNRPKLVRVHLEPEPEPLVPEDPGELHLPENDDEFLKMIEDDLRGPGT